MEILALPGIRGYDEVHALQLELVEKRARDEIDDIWITVEHSPTVTRGKGLQWTGSPRERARPLIDLPAHIQYREIERGGDLTYHGPGQWVVYPIVKLGESAFAPKKDVEAFVRSLERVVSELLREWSLEGFAKPAATGVWVKNAAHEEKKIASLGIAVRKWVTYHGLALNMTTDLADFTAISPCGFESGVMDKVENLSPIWNADSRTTWRSSLDQGLARVLNRP